MSDIDQRIASLPPEKRALLLKRLAEKEAAQAGAKAAAPAMPTRDPALPAHLSFAQQRLWFLERLQPGTALYNNPAAFRMRGAVDVAALEYGLAQLVRRHEALRTVFTERDGQPLQVILPSLEPKVALVDLRELPEPAREAEALRLAQEEAQRPFDLETGPLLRVGLLRLSEREHLLLLTMHHIISDGWSLEVLVREAVTFYAARLSGAPAALAPLPVQYADFAAWQRGWLQGDVLRTQLDYWKERLGGTLPVLQLPTDRPRPAALTQRGATHSFLLPAATQRKLEALCAQEGVTLFMALLAVFQLLLARHTSQEDLVVGTPIAGRNRRETEGLIGFFINTLVLRTDLSRDPSLRELLRRVKEVCLGAYAHQDLPFETLVEALQPERHLSRTPLFQVMFNLQNTSPGPGQQALAGLTLSPLDLHPGTSMFDLSLSLAPHAQGLTGLFEYSTDLFDPATVARLGERYLALVEGLVADPSQRAWALPLMTETERRQVVRAWSNASARPAREACLHTLFEEQVARTPDAVALVFQERSLTYRELDARSRQLAGHLRALGVGPDVRVGLCLERSLELIIGMLGILQAGGAYVPMDPALPAGRLALLLEDSAAPVLLTQQRLLARLPAHAARVLCLDSDWERIASGPGDTRPPAVGPGQVAYVIYTSGSTGRPKGVLIEHRAACTLVAAEAPIYGVGPGSRMLQFANVSFDISVEEIFTALTSGATLCLAPADALAPGRPLQEHLREAAITVVSLTPAVLAATPSEDLPALRVVISGGESCPAELVARWGAGRRFFNTYGPTEGTVVATLVECVTGDEAPPIGRPLEHVEVYVLDARLEPVPPGVHGELYLGGAGLARGYLDRPALTAERFIPHPFATAAGQRLYRTGDVVRFREDGQLAYLGRADTQVKVRGFRIEPGEVEAVVRGRPEVRDAAVLVREDAPGDKRLVAYAVPAPGHSLDAAVLRRALKDALPDYMVPSAFVVLDALPLTPNGKLDRAALPAPVQGAGREREYAAPRTDVQRQLADIWSELLRVERVGLHDDFFALGGHSLLTTQVLSRIRRVFQVELPLRELFDAPTLAGLSVAVEAAIARGQGVHRPPLERAPREARLLPSFAQQRLLFLEELEPGSPLYNIPAVVLLEGALDAGALEAALSEVLRRHESLRTTFHVDDAGPFVRIAASAPRALEQVDLGPLPEGDRLPEALRLAQEEAQRPFALATGPLQRARLLRLEARRHVLVLTMHHIVSDGWSMGLLVREVGALYAAFHAGQPSPLPELAFQYTDFAAWQRGWLHGPALEAQLDWWRQQLAGAAPVLDLPTDRPRPATQTFRGATVPVRMPVELALAVRERCQEEGVTPFMLLLAAFQVLLHRYSGQDDISVGSPIAGRNVAESEDLLGLFVNSLVLRARLGEATTFRELLAQVRETTLGAYAHQDLPFERLVEALRPARDLSRPPLFQVMFVHDQEAQRELALPDLTLRPLGIEQRTSKFDLTLFLSVTPDGLGGAFEYNADLFDAATLERMAGHLQHLLRAAVAQPALPLSRLPLLPEREAHQVLRDWNATHAAFAGEDCLHHAIEAQALRTPDALAVLDDTRTLTFQELDAHANRLARYLMLQGVGPESRVALCLERGVELVVAVLAILKSGGAYVPIDPAYPHERQAFVVKDSGTRLVVTQTLLAARFDAPGVAVLCLDDSTVREALGHQSAAPPPRVGRPEHLAYVIYTSGSTGWPKGVMIEHASVMNLRGALADTAHAGTRVPQRVTLNAPLVFDASVQQLVRLADGHALCVVPQEARADAALLVAWLERHAVDVLDCSPSHLRLLLEEGLGAKRPLRVLVGGEAVDAALWAALAAHPRIDCFNVYGPTECTVDSTCRAVRGTERPTLGGPLANARAYVLDGHLRPVPVGVPGELFIGGAGLARGYLGRSDLTAERFLPHPFATVPGERLYRTGDKARWLATGELDFLGRADFQVKLRGFRIELGEIEAVLARHATVGKAVVAVREDSPGHPRLVAYVVPAPGAQLASAALREHAEQRLPEFMVPTVFVTLASLPLTVNGKVDRRALPAPEPVTVTRAATGARTPVEHTLVAVWASVLRREDIGIHDNFFELGGDSISSMQVSSRARQAGLRVTPKQLFRHQTIAELARVVTQGASRPEEQGPVTGRVPLTPIQHVFFQQGSPQPHHFNQSVLLEPRERLDAARLARALEHVTRHHDALRTRFTRTAEGWEQHVDGPGATAATSQVDLSHLPEVARSPALEQAAATVQRGFRLEQGPLLHAALFERGEGQSQRLLLVVHHLVVDAVSWRYLLEDLETAYQHLGRGEPVVLPPKTTSFKTWAERLEAHARSEALERELPFWLAGAAQAARPLPVDKAGENTLASARTHTVSLEAEETRVLLQEALATFRARVDDVLLTALVLAFARWTGQPRLRVDREGHGREELFDDVDLSRTVGWFTAMSPVSLEAAPAESPLLTLRRVGKALRAVPGKGLGHGLLTYLRADAASRRLQSQPRAQVLFNYLGQLDTLAAGTALFALASESGGPAQSDQGPRSHLLEVNGGVFQGRLEMAWTYSENLHEPGTIEALARGYLEALRALLAEHHAQRASRLPRVDLSLAELDRHVLEQVLEQTPGLEDLYPLSPVQEGMLFHARLGPGSGVYFEQLAWTFRGPVDMPRLQRAWRELVERNAILRTTFLWESVPQPLQVVRARVELEWAEHDWRGLDATQQQARREALLDEDRARGFDLVRTPPSRVAMVRVAEGEWRCHWSFHHLLLDGWSVGLLFDELFALYDALEQGTPPRERAPEYRGYIAWLKQQDLGEAESWWRRTLSGFTTPTPLPESTAAVREGAGVPAVKELKLRLPDAMTESLQAFTRRHRVTLNTLAQGTWGLVLGRHAGVDDVVFGATVSGRPPALAGVEGMVGMFINTLPVRVRLPSHEGLLPWLQQLQEQQLELRQFEHSPLVQVQGWSQVPRGTALFDSILVFENYPLASEVMEQARRLEMDDVELLDRTHYPLSACVMPQDATVLMLSYDTERFSDATIQVLLGQWRTALEQLLEAPGGRLSDLTLLSPDERQRMLFAWNDSHVAFTQDTCAHHLFAAQAALTPDAPALECEGTTLTYRELDSRANQLAHHLRLSGVGPDTPVGLCCERSPELVIGMLGILKAGGAFLPLDPGHPPERIAFVLRDAAAPILLTQSAIADELPSQGEQVVCLDDDWRAIARQPTHAPATRVLPDHLAYVIYTSGSTGLPKGTLLHHRGLCNTAQAAVLRHGFGPASRVLQFASPSFDASVCEVFSCLLAGACLVLAPAHVLLPGAPLQSFLAAHSISAATLTPSVLALLEPEALPSLRTVISAGEACPPELSRRWAPGRSLLNAYGPTEASVCASINTRLGPDSLHIGSPWPNTSLFVLDSSLRPVPLGAPGELFISGVGLARGYLGQPSLTAERFLPHPFSSSPGARLYRTGDRARWLPDGNLQFLGRLDDQVKLRGIRIELGEVEAALRLHPFLSDVALLLREDSAGDKRLVAYFTASQPPQASELRSFLEQRLPSFMVPSAFVLLDALPLTAAGKVDRKALPPPEQLGLTDRYVAPRTPTEELLAGLWADMLGHERVGVQDDFFELGGHSLLAAQLITRIRATFDRELSLNDLFEAPTVAALALKLGAVQEFLPLSPVEPCDPVEELPLSLAQQAYWSPERGGPASPLNSVPMAFRVDGPLDETVLARALTELVRRHEILRTTFPRVDGVPVQRIAAPGDFPLACLDLEPIAEAQREQAALSRLHEAAWRPFDLEEGPLMRALLLRLEEERHLLLLNLHHALTDLVSGQVLMTELATLHDAFQHGRESPLAEPPLQYRDFTRWQHAWLRGEVLDGLRSWWGRKLEAPLPLPALPREPSPEAGDGGPGAGSVPFTLTPEVSGQLVALSRREGVTPFILLMASFQVLLARASGHEEALVAFAHAHRPRPELERMPGMFANLLVVRTPLAGNPGFREVLRRARAAYLEAFEHAGLPHGELMRLLGASSTRAPPALPAGFSFAQVGKAPQGLPGLTLSPVPLELEQTVSDVSLSVLQGPDGFGGSFEYRAGLFRRETLEALGQAFVGLLERVAVEPEARVDSLVESSGVLAGTLTGRGVA
ncbi:non-ribosomal peptide synthase [Corallococcus coralloides]|uniref:Non-ribosomal peptide synthase n=1 Tax=Corallococcus coralloides TaxID=184914 RepID=A0A410RS69_CORCK|nr:non-ribosomal peptide synthetase [Corallococcus coralloides]QAT84764.1 non-ribosomal peptide synthase [Corallococcus coralloides]